MTQDRRISKAGLDLIKRFEGLRLRSEFHSGSQWIVGYGHTSAAREGIEVTEKEAEYLLRYDLQKFETLVCTNASAVLSPNEFDALVAFAWNVGEDAFLASDVLKYVNAGQKLAAGESFSAWRLAQVGGKLIVMDALVRRRSAEKHLFLNGPGDLSGAPTALVTPEHDKAASVMALSSAALSVEVETYNCDQPRKYDWASVQPCGTADEMPLNDNDEPCQSAPEFWAGITSLNLVVETSLAL